MGTHGRSTQSQSRSFHRAVAEVEWKYGRRRRLLTVCCVMHVKRTQCTYREDEWFRPRCSWFDWLHIVPQYLVNHYMVFCLENSVILVAPHTLQENTEC